MQSTAIQIKTHSKQDVKKQSSPADDEKSTNAEMVDPFLQIIMSLITPTQNTQPTDSALASSGTNQLGELTALLQNSSAGMIALLSTMLKGETGSDTGLASNGAAVLAGLMNSEAMTDSSGQAAANAALGTQANAIPSAYSEQLSQAMNLSDMLGLDGKNADTTGKVAISSEALAQMTKLLGLSDKEELQTLLKNSGIQVISGEEALAKAGISEATVKAKEMISNYLSQQTEQDEIDVDNLQNEIAKLNSRTPFEFNLKAVGETSDANTLDQLTDGIKQNISIGKSEFAIKLTPETLGEITVKLVEEAGKTTLTITTANEQAAKLINKDLDALREAVAPMNVEVRYAVVSTNESAGGSMQQYNMTGQQFAGQQFAGQQSFLQMTQTASGQTENQASDDIYASSQAAQMMALSSNRLDAYI